MSQRLVGSTFSSKKSSGWATIPFLFVEDTLVIPADMDQVSKLVPLGVPQDWFGTAPSASFFVNILGVNGGVGLTNQIVELHFTLFAGNIVMIAKRSPTDWDLAAAMNIADPATGGFEWDGFTPLTPVYGAQITISFQLILMANNPERLKH